MSMALNTALCARRACCSRSSDINRDIGLMRVLGDRGPAGSLARTALPFVLLVPVLVGLARLSGQRAGFYGTEDGVALQVFANIVGHLRAAGGCIILLFRSDKARRDRELAMSKSEGQYRHAEQVGHIGHWQIEYPSGRGPMVG